MPRNVSGPTRLKFGLNVEPGRFQKYFCGEPGPQNYFVCFAGRNSNLCCGAWPRSLKVIFDSASLSRRHFLSADAGSYKLVCPTGPSPQIWFLWPHELVPPICFVAQRGRGVQKLWLDQAVSKSFFCPTGPSPKIFR